MGSSSIVLYYSARTAEGHERRRLYVAILISLFDVKLLQALQSSVCRIQEEHSAGRHENLAIGAIVTMAARHEGIAAPIQDTVAFSHRLFSRILARKRQTYVASRPAFSRRVIS
jgi:hypothetical protein